MTLILQFFKNAPLRRWTFAIVWFISLLNFQRFVEGYNLGSTSVQTIKFFEWFYGLFGVYPNFWLWVLYGVGVTILVQGATMAYLFFFLPYFYKWAILRYRKIVMAPEDQIKHYYMIGLAVAIGLVLFAPILSDEGVAITAYRVDIAAQFAGFAPNWVMPDPGSTSAADSLKRALGALIMVGSAVIAIAPELITTAFELTSKLESLVPNDLLERYLTSDTAAAKPGSNTAPRASADVFLVSKKKD